jgi:hypothetical protein
MLYERQSYRLYKKYYVKEKFWAHAYHVEASDECVVLEEEYAQPKVF